MAGTHRTVSVFLEYVDHETGHWCNRCLLSTGMRFWIACHMTGRMHLQTRWHCYECGGSNITPEPGSA